MAVKLGSNDDDAGDNGEPAEQPAESDAGDGSDDQHAQNHYPFHESPPVDPTRLTQQSTPTATTADAQPLPQPASPPATART